MELGTNETDVRAIWPIAETNCIQKFHFSTLILIFWIYLLIKTELFNNRNFGLPSQKQKKD